MAYGRHTEKSKNWHISEMIDRSARKLARWRTLALQTVSAVKISTF